ncbi:MAG: apolipoprotein N-acyltransferase [Bacteroidota bacterium]
MKRYFPSIIILVSLLSTFLIGNQIFLRARQELLWGHLSLFAFLSFWTMLAALFFRKDLMNLKLDHPFTWSTLSGLLLGIAFPGDIGLTPLLFIAFIPLLRVEYLIGKDQSGSKRWQVFRYSFHAFAIWNIISTYWLANASLGAGIFAVTANSALMALVIVLYHQTKIILPRFNYISLLVYWLGFEYFHYRWDLAWPWLTVGNGLAPLPSLIQWYEYTGALGGTVYILGVNILLFRLLQGFLFSERKKVSPRVLIYTLLLLFLPMVISFLLAGQNQDATQEIEVIAIQPNYEPHYEKDKIAGITQVEEILGLAQQYLSPTTDYLVLPESTFGYFRLDQFDKYPEVQRLQDLLTTYPNLNLVGGFSIYNELGNNPITSPSVRKRVLDGKTIYFEVYNAALQMNSKKTKADMYKKSKLVPGPEFFPFATALGFLKPVVESFGGTTASFGTQPKRAVFDGATKVAPVICYESVFGQYLTQYIRRGAQTIFIMTNDGWWDNTAGHRQHQQFARLRAIESRKPIVRAASTGISCFISPQGKLSNITSYNEATAISTNIQPNNRITFYVRWGDIIGRLSLFIGVLFLLNTIVKSIKPE